MRPQNMYIMTEVFGGNLIGKNLASFDEVHVAY